MRRADRLFSIIQLLRRRKLVRAQDLAERLEVSQRTVYRDIRDLIGSGVPIEGEAGVGYLLRSGFDLPPLMFSEEEIEALVLGARIVRSWADPQLAGAAGNVLDKIDSVLPDRLRHYMDDTRLYAPDNHFREPVAIDVAELRRAVRSRLKMAIAYRGSTGDVTRRTVRPMLLAFFGPIWTLSGWCELRAAFRTFRLDRISELSVLDEPFPAEPGRGLEDCLRHIDLRIDAPAAGAARR
jgi:predicted DNA-binding transcriptional regulator YafY